MAFWEDRWGRSLNFIQMSDLEQKISSGVQIGTIKVKIF
jgi:hypothetical protein